MTVTIRDLLERHRDAWVRATTSPFLDGVRDGTLTDAAFDRWLEQDRLFVEALARAWARILAGAPGRDLALLSGGIAAFIAEVEWFDGIVARRGLDPSPDPLPDAAAYIDWLGEVAARPYAVALSAMWVVEAAYLDAWRGAAPGAPGYAAFVDHWTSSDFAAFVDQLEAAANVALGEAAPPDIEAAANAIAATADHERRFWELTVDPSTPR